MADQVMRLSVPKTNEDAATVPVATSAAMSPPGQMSLEPQGVAAQPTGQAGPACASVDRVLASSGRPLDPTLKREMEQRFGHDFSRVRLHSGASAEQSAQDVNAHAYTVGHDIVFGAGRFAPRTQQGRRLIAHELTHVVQQSGSGQLRSDQGEERGLPRQTNAVAVTSTGGRLLQRQALVEGEQTLPRVQVGRDDKNPNRLLLRLGDEVVATLEVRGKAASVDDIQLRDRTGARNLGQRIDTIDIDVVHPPGVSVTLEVSRSSLAKTKQRFGILDVKVRPVEAKPPYGKDELQLWPRAHDLGTMRQRRPLTAAERAEQERRRAEERARELEVSAETAKAWQTYHMLKGVLDHSEQSLKDLRSVGIANLFIELPLPTIWNDVDKELFLAAKALDQRFPSRARVHLGRADAALKAANAKVWAAVQSGLASLKIAERITAKVGQISLFVGETAARLIPGPLGRFLTFLYEVLKPAPKTPEEAADRLRGALHSGMGPEPGRPPAPAPSRQPPSGPPTTAPPSRQLPAGPPTTAPPSRQLPSGPPTTAPPSRQLPPGPTTTAPPSRQLPAGAPTTAPPSRQLPSGPPTTTSPSRQLPSGPPTTTSPSRQLPSGPPTTRAPSRQLPSGPPTTAPPSRQLPAGPTTTRAPSRQLPPATVQDLGGTGTPFGVISTGTPSGPLYALARRGVGVQTNPQGQPAPTDHRGLARAAWGYPQAGERRFGVTPGSGPNTPTMVHEASGTTRPEISDLPAIGVALRNANLLENALVQVGRGAAARWYQWRDGQWVLVSPGEYR